MEKKVINWAVIRWIMIAAQGLASVLFLYFVYQNGMIPNRYILYLGFALLLFEILVLCIGKLKSAKKSIACIVISLAVIGVLAAGHHYILLIEQSLDSISVPIVEEVDVMVVAVRVDDPAQDIQDTKGYLFGVSGLGDTEKNAKTVSFLNTTIGQDIKTENYENPMDEVEALLSNQCDAIIYNEAYAGALEEGIEEYNAKVKALYKFDLKTEVSSGKEESQKKEKPKKENQKKDDEQEKTGVEKPFTVYISGIDVEGPISTTSRSDVNILMTINPDTHWILLTTTPRDYYVYIPEVSGDSRDKLTHAGIYGINASIAALEELYEIPIDYYVRVNFTSVITIVDALGGVDVYSEYAFEVGDFSYEEGINHLSGIEALAFSRERYAFKEGDNQRGKNQQAVLSAIIDKVTSYAALSHADELLSVVSECTQTSISKEEIKTLVKRQMEEDIHWKIYSQAATGSGDSQPTFSTGKRNLYVMWPDEEVVEALSDKMNAVLEGKDPTSQETEEPSESNTTQD